MISETTVIVFKTLAFIAIWTTMIASSIWVGKTFGLFFGIIFFAFGAGLVGFAGMLVVVAIARLFGIDLLK